MVAQLQPEVANFRAEPVLQNLGDKIQTPTGVVQGTSDGDTGSALSSGSLPSRGSSTQRSASASHFWIGDSPSRRPALHSASRQSSNGRRGGLRLSDYDFKDQDEDPQDLFVGGLGADTGEDALKTIFDTAARIRLLRNGESGESKRCAIVHYDSVAACQRQLHQARDGVLEAAGTRLRVSPRRRRPPSVASPRRR